MHANPLVPFLKTKAFRPGVVDLPTESTVAPLAAITLPETFGEYDISMPEGEIEYSLHRT